MTERGALWVMRLAGSAVLVLFLVGVLVAPSAPVTANVPGFANPVVGFELASTPEQVLGILGRPGSYQRGETLVRMRLALWVDCLFMLAYPAFYVGIAQLLAARGGVPRRVAAAVGALAVLMAVGDALENRELLVLTRAVDPAAMTAPLARLRPFTLLKWYALFTASALVAPPIWRQQGWWRWSAPFFALAAVLGLVSLVHLPAIEWSMAPVAVAWTMSYVRAFRRLPPEQSASGRTFG